MSEAPSYIERPFHRPRVEFTRDNNDLVDLSDYLPYLVDDPDAVPIVLTQEQRKEGSWVNQHVYFQKTFYQQRGLDDWKKDKVLAKFCSTPYNQIVMRRWEEEKLHRLYEEHVTAPNPEPMRQALIDFSKFDLLGAAAIGRRVALVPEALEYISPGAGTAALSSISSPIERANYFDKTIEAVLKKLDPPLILPERLVVGAINRLSQMFNTDRLKKEVEYRLPKEEVYIPVGVRHPSLYYQMSLDLLKDAALVEDNQKRMRDGRLTALQTGVDVVELAA
jgi:hypothetical protein